MNATPWAVARRAPADSGIMGKRTALPIGVEPIVFEVTVPPSLNALFLNNKGGRGKGRIKTREYKLWIAEATYDIRRQVTHRMEGKYFIHYRINRDCTEADIWNLEKAVPDLLKKEGVIKDDRYCEGGTIYWSDKPTQMLVSILSAE